MEFEDTGFLERNITNASRIVKDLPLYLGIGYATKPYSTFGAGYGVGSIRETFLTMREKGQVGTWGEFWDAYRKYGIKAGLKEGAQLSVAGRFGRISNKFFVLKLFSNIFFLNRQTKNPFFSEGLIFKMVNTKPSVNLTFYEFIKYDTTLFIRTTEGSASKEKFKARKDKGAFCKGLEAARRIRTACRQRWVLL